MRVLITGARAPVALEWANLLYQQGDEVFMTDSLGNPLGALLSCIERYIQTSSSRFDFANYQAEILDIIDQFNIEMVIPTCEEIFYLANVAPLRPKINWFMPDAALLLALHNKQDVFDMLHGLPEIALPATTSRISNSEVVINNETILKPLYSRFGKQVIRDISAATLSEIEISAQTPWVQQQKISGQPICNYGLFEHGELKVQQAYLPKYCVNQSAASAFQPIYDPAIERFMVAFGKRFNYHGQVSFDFILEKDLRYVIECNPRATSGLHLIAPFCYSFHPHCQFSLLKLDQLHHIGSIMFFSEGVRSFFKLKTWQDHYQGKHVMKHRQKRFPLRAYFYSVFELYRLARKNKITLSEASTYDIEWNGEQL